jgi:diguanylate cyclase
VSKPATDPIAAAPALSPRNLSSLPHRTYRFRMLGMGLASLPQFVVYSELQSHWASWAWTALCCLVWPHLAYLMARRSKDPLRAELRNFVIDSMMAGSWVPLMHFNLLPSVVLLTVANADKINSGVRGLWLRSLPGMVGALLVVGLATGFAFQPQTSLWVMLACLPILVIHTMAVSLSTYRLVRKLQRQNQRFEELSQRDALTGLFNRRHWQDKTEQLLRRHQDVAEPATLALLDVDRFKDINDCHGHAAGDDVLRAIAAVLVQDSMAQNSHAGRLGGDEFAIALPLSMAQAQATAERLRAAVESFEFGNVPGLRCSVSIGLASPPDDSELGLREWIEAADRALYHAKRTGRNRVVGQDLEPEADNA